MCPALMSQPRRRRTGEPLVWMTAMGLTIGLVMVVSLLGLIVTNGISVFWPQQVVQAEIKAGSKASIEGSQVLVGKILKVQQKLWRSMTTNTATAASTTDATEWQLFIGNKDAYGTGFQYVDLADITQVSYPADIAVMERLEYGDAIGYLVALHIHGEGDMAAPDPQFASRLQTLIAETTRRREQIRYIERTAIGAINVKMHTLRLQQRALERDQRAADSPAFKAIHATIGTLQGQYEALAKQARVLRQQQEEHFLTYRLPTGKEKRLPLGQVVEVYFPNQLSFSQRLGLFLHHGWIFLTTEPREANTEGGVFPAIFGTFVMTVLMSLAVTPFGVLAALYLREYAKQGVAVRAVRVAVNNLAGVPSIVFGVFGLGFFVYFVGSTIDEIFYASTLPTPTFGTGGIVWASLTLALMTVPVVVVATEEALAAVPRGMREGSLACGASKWQTIQRIVLPAAAPGILTGLILAMARGAGEVAPLMLVGVVKLAPTLPIDTLFPFLHLDRKFMHLGFHIFDLGFQSPDSEAAKPMVFATTLLLIVLVVVLNLGAIFIRDRLRKKYATGAF